MGCAAIDPAPQTVTTVPAVAMLRCRGPVRYKMMKGSMNVPARLTSVPTHNHQNGAGSPPTRAWRALRARPRGDVTTAAAASPSVRTSLALTRASLLLACAQPTTGGRHTTTEFRAGTRFGRARRNGWPAG